MRDTDRDALTGIYRVLAMFDLLGFYAESRWVDERTVFAEWGDSLDRSRSRAAHVIEWRKEITTRADWPHYQRLARLAPEGPPESAMRRLIGRVQRRGRGTTS